MSARSFAPCVLFAAGLLLAGCPAHLATRAYARSAMRSGETEVANARPAEADGVLYCSGRKVPSVQVTRQWHEVFHNPFFLTGAGLELAGGGALLGLGLQQDGSAKTAMAAAGGALLGLALIDLATFAIDRSWERDARGLGSADIRLDPACAPLEGELKGVRGPLDPWGLGFSFGAEERDLTRLDLTQALANARAAAAARPSTPAAAPAPAPAAPPPPAVAPAAPASRPLVVEATRPAPAPAPAPARARKKLAVLELKNAGTFPKDQIAYFTDLVRSVAFRQGAGWDVMTRENLLVLLQATGKDLANCEGECEVDTGRRIGADAVVSGALLKLGSRLKLTLVLHRTDDGLLLGTEDAQGKSVEQLDDSAQQACQRLVGHLK